MNNLIIFEDNFTNLLKPFSINHASFELQTGLFSNLERFQNIFNNKRIIFVIRNEIKILIQEIYPNTIINPDVIPTGECINGCAVINDSEYKKISSNDIVRKNNQLLYYRNKTD